jgi:hypothetical protein
MARANGTLPTSKMRQSLRVLAVVSSARTVRHFSAGSGGMRINIVITADQTGRAARFSLAGATFMTLGTCFLGREGSS